MEKKIFVFDMDGVLINSVDSLLGLYEDFLKKFNMSCEKDELKSINGMNIKEIVKFMKEKHNLFQGEDFLEKEYDKEMKERYERVELVDGVESVLKFLHNKALICLASSSKRQNIDYILDKFGLKKFFDFIVSGDDVEEAKPSPKIYQKISSRFGEKEYYVVEDSFNGLKAAKLAGMKTIFYNPEDKKLDIRVDFTIKNLGKAVEIFLEEDTNVKVLYLGKNFSFVIKKYHPPLEADDMKIVEKTWEEETEKNPSLFNGEIVSYLSHEISDGKIIINCFITKYKFFLAKFKGRVNIKIFPLVVNCVSFCNEEFVVAKRRRTTEYRNYWEFPSSGSINSKSIFESFPSQSQIKEELLEETGVEIDLEKIKPFCLLLDKKNELYSVGCSVNLDLSLMRADFKSKEYSESKTLKFEEVEDFMEENDFVPISKMIFYLNEIEEGKNR